MPNQKMFSVCLIGAAISAVSAYYSNSQKHQPFSDTASWGKYETTAIVIGFSFIAVFPIYLTGKHLSNSPAVSSCFRAFNSSQSASVYVGMGSDPGGAQADLYDPFLPQSQTPA